MLTITRKIEFDAGHRLTKHESKCRNVHGHRYVALITCRAPQLDEVGRVIDFGKIKEIVGGWLDDKWDHGFIAESTDPIVAWLSKNDMKTYVMSTPPTVENMVKHLFRASFDLLKIEGIEVTNVRLYETPNCFADFNPGA